MMTGFDELVERLLYDVALSGSRGLDAEDLAEAVKTFYQDHNPKQPALESQADLLFSDTPPSEPHVVDDNFVEAVWAWLEKHPDVEIRTVDDAEQTDSVSASKHAGKRIFAGEDRIWNVIAGHGVNYNRIPQREFECLLVIAAHGSDGVLQPDVTKATGQDKRSVPKRTDHLAQKGYIVKEKAPGVKIDTSLLKLRRFAQEIVKPSDLSADVRAPSKRERDAPERAIWLDTIMRVLQENDGIATTVDLRSELGVYKNSKPFITRTQELADMGCVRKLKARVENEDGGMDQFVRCLQLVRKPTEKNRLEFVSGKTTDEPLNASEAVDIDADEDEVAEYMEDEAIDGQEEDESTAQETRIPPQWTPDLPYTNLVFNIVDNAGPEGISSMDLCARATGPMWRRALDEVMLKLTDAWQTSQPPHLRHLGIIRDTALIGRTTHFQFRSYRNFVKAVELGLTEWSAVTNDDLTGKGKQKANHLPTPDLDEWGFPKLHSSLFAGNTGTASLRECQKEPRAEYQALAESDGIVASAIGSTSVGDALQSFEGRKPRTPSKTKFQPPKRTFDPDRTPIVRYKRRKTTEEDQEQYGRAARQRAERLVRAEMNVARRPSLMDDMRTEEVGRIQTVAPPEGLSDPSLDAEPTLEALSESRVQEVEADILSRTKPGVYINPPGAKDAKFETFISIGRPRRMLIAVFKSEKLKALEWFKEEGPRIARKSDMPFTSRRVVEMLEDGHENDELTVANDAAEATMPPKKKRRVNETIATAAKLVGSGEAARTGQERALPSTKAGCNERRTYPKEFTLEHPEFEWYHCGFGRYKKMHHLTQTPGAVDSQSPAVPGTRKSARRVSTESPITTTSATTVSASSRETVSKEYAVQHPEFAYVHRGHGRYMRVSGDSAKAKTSTPTANAATMRNSENAEQTPRLESPTVTDPDTATERPNSRGTFSKEQTLKHPDVEWVHRGKGRYVPASELQTPLKAADRLPLDDEAAQSSPDGIAHQESTQEDAAPKARPEYRSKAYTLQHPEINWTHRGNGRFLPAPDQANSPAVSNVLAENASVNAGAAQTVTEATEQFTQSLIAKLPVSPTSASQVISNSASHELSKSPRARSRPNALPNGHAFPKSVSQGGLGGPDVTTNGVVATVSSALQTPSPAGWTVVRPYVDSIEPGSTEPNTLRSQADVSAELAPDNLLELDDNTEQPVVPHDKAAHMYGTEEKSQPTQAHDSSMPTDDVELNEANDQEDIDHVADDSVLTSNDDLQDGTWMPVHGDETGRLLELVPADMNKAARYKDKDPKKAGITRGGGVVDFRRRQIVMDTIRKAGGIFPGQNEMWFPFATAWHQMYKQNPDRHTTENLVSGLVTRNLLKKFRFTFKNEDGELVERYILTEPDIDSTSQQVKKMQQSIIKAYPYRYLPPEVNIDKRLREQARKYPALQSMSKRKERQQAEDEEDDHDAAYKPPSGTPQAKSVSSEFPIDYRLTVKRTGQAATGGDGASSLSKRKTSENIPRTPLAKRRKVATPKKQQVANVRKTPSPELEDDTDLSGEDSDAEASAAQLVLQNDFQLLSYHHDPAMVPDKPLGKVQPRMSLSIGGPIVYSRKRRSSTKGKTVVLKMPKEKKQAPAEGQLDTTGDSTEAKRDSSQSIGTLGGRPVYPGPDMPSGPLLTWASPIRSARDLTTPSATDAAQNTTSLGKRKRVQTYKARENIDDMSPPIPLPKAQLNPALEYHFRCTHCAVINRSCLGSSSTQKCNFCAKTHSLCSQVDADRQKLQQQGKLRADDDGLTAIAIGPARTLTAESIPQTEAVEPAGLDDLGKARIDALADRDPDFQPAIKRGATTKTDRKPTRQKRLNAIDPGDYERLTKAVALVRMLANGVQDVLSNHWHIVAHAFNFRYDVKGLESQWRSQTRDEQLGSKAVQKIQIKLHEPFLTAYGNGALPAIDFDNLERTDWPALLRWVENEVLPRKGTEKLPQTRAGLEANFEVQPLSRAVTEPIDGAIDEIDRSEMLAQRAFCLEPDGMIVRNTKDPQIDLDQNGILAKSWVRAISATKDENYRQNEAVQKLRMLGNAAMEKALDEMKQTRTISQVKSGRQRPGRNFYVSDYVYSQFKRWPSTGRQSTFLHDVADARAKIVQHFQEHDELDSSTASEAEALVLEESRRDGRLKTIVDVPEHFKHTSKASSEKLYSRVKYCRTAQFGTEIGLKAGIPIPVELPMFPNEKHSRIPFWVDIHGNLIEQIWELVLSSVLYLLVFGPTYTTKEIEKAHNSKLWAWETELVLEWMEKVGLAERMRFGGGWKASGRWYCAFLPEIATWQSRAELSRET